MTGAGRHRGPATATFTALLRNVIKSGVFGFSNREMRKWDEFSHGENAGYYAALFKGHRTLVNDPRSSVRSILRAYSERGVKTNLPRAPCPRAAFDASHT